MNTYPKLSEHQATRLQRLIDRVRFRDSDLTVAPWNATWAEAQDAVSRRDYWRCYLLCEQTYLPACDRGRRIIAAALKILKL